MVENKYSKLQKVFLSGNIQNYEVRNGQLQKSGLCRRLGLFLGRLIRWFRSVESKDNEKLAKLFEQIVLPSKSPSVYKFSAEPLPFPFHPFIDLINGFFESFFLGKIDPCIAKFTNVFSAQNQIEKAGNLLEQFDEQTRLSLIKAVPPHIENKNDNFFILRALALVSPTIREDEQKVKTIAGMFQKVPKYSQKQFLYDLLQEIEQDERYNVIEFSVNFLTAELQGWAAVGMFSAACFTLKGQLDPEIFLQAAPLFKTVKNLEQANYFANIFQSNLEPAYIVEFLKLSACCAKQISDFEQLKNVFNLLINIEPNQMENAIGAAVPYFSKFFSDHYKIKFLSQLAPIPEDERKDVLEKFSTLFKKTESDEEKDRLIAILIKLGMSGRLDVVADAEKYHKNIRGLSYISILHVVSARPKVEWEPFLEEIAANINLVTAWKKYFFVGIMRYFPADQLDKVLVPVLAFLNRFDSPVLLHETYQLFEKNATEDPLKVLKHFVVFFDSRIGNQCRKYLEPVMQLIASMTDKECREYLKQALALTENFADRLDVLKALMSIPKPMFCNLDSDLYRTVRNTANDNKAFFLRILGHVPLELHVEVIVSSLINSLETMKNEQKEVFNTLLRLPAKQAADAATYLTEARLNLDTALSIVDALYYMPDLVAKPESLNKMGKLLQFVNYSRANRSDLKKTYALVGKNHLYSLFEKIVNYWFDARDVGVGFDNNTIGENIIFCLNHVSFLSPKDWDQFLVEAKKIKETVLDERLIIDYLSEGSERKNRCHDHLYRQILGACNSENKELFFWIVNQIRARKESYLLSNEDYLWKICFSVKTDANISANHPRFVHYFLQAMAKRSTSKLPLCVHDFNGKRVVCNRDKFFELSKKNTVITYKKVPEFTHPRVFFAKLDQRLHKLNKGEKIEVMQYIKQITGSNYTFLKNNLAADPNINLFAVRGESDQEAPLSHMHLAMLMRYVENVSNELKGKLLSDQEELLLAYSMSIQNCREGKQTGLYDLWKQLPAEYSHSRLADNNALDNLVGDDIRSLILNIVKEAISEENPITRALTDRESQGMAQAPHQFNYITNLIGFFIGAKSNREPLFDSHTQVVYKHLLELSLEDALKIFYQHFTPQYQIQVLKNAVSRQRLPMQIPAPFFNFLNKDYFDGKLQLAWEMDEEGELTGNLTTKGAEILTEALGLWTEVNESGLD